MKYRYSHMFLYALALMCNSFMHAAEVASSSIELLSPYEQTPTQFKEQVLQSIDINATQDDEMYKGDHLTRVPVKKNALFLVYIAADNNLDSFAWYNLQQMATVGSNANVNIIVQLNVPGNDTLTQRYLVTKNNLVPAAGYTATDKLDSGDPQTLVDFVLWATTYYPADNIYLVLWDHGSGILDPEFGRTLNRDMLYILNQETNMLELDRSMTYAQQIQRYIQTHLEAQHTTHYTTAHGRGVCFDDTFLSYITHDGLEYALNTITTSLGKKLEMVGFDACYMAALEVTTICKSYAKYMVGSEEVEPGTGWNYQKVLSIFAKPTPPTAVNFAKQTVISYDKTYKNATRDYTLSAVDLTKTAALETAINRLATLLLQGLARQRNNSVLQALNAAMLATVYFYEPTYIDLNHFLMNLLSRLSSMTLINSAQNTAYRNSLRTVINQGLAAIKNAVVANATGTPFRNAKGLSIYFPYVSMDSSYPATQFAQHNAWVTLMTQFLALTT